MSVGSSWADFADQLALSKLGSARIEGCSLASVAEGPSQEPLKLVEHIDSLLDDVFQVGPIMRSAAVAQHMRQSDCTACIFALRRRQGTAISV